MTECNQEEIKNRCLCTYDCSRRGKCCENIEYQLKSS